jgi:tellurite resistance protein TehA-like permease
MGPERDWLITTLRILFWIYAGCTVVSSWLQYWAFVNFTPTNVFEMNPAWFLPAYAVMLTGTVASLVAPSQEPRDRVPIIVAGVTYQGYGFMASYLFLVMYAARLIQSGLPGKDLRPGLFFPVGLIGYTITALMGLSKAIPRDYGYFADHPSSPEILSVMALWASIFLWVFGFFLFSIAFLGCLEQIPKIGFTLSWWAFVFPNIGFTLATINIGRQLKSEGILWVTSVATILLVAVWLFTLGALIRAVWIRRIMWPGRDEDKDIQLFKNKPLPQFALPSCP